MKDKDTKLMDLKRKGKAGSTLKKEYFPNNSIKKRQGTLPQKQTPLPVVGPRNLLWLTPGDTIAPLGTQAQKKTAFRRSFFVGVKGFEPLTLCL